MLFCKSMLACFVWVQVYPQVRCVFCQNNNHDAPARAQILIAEKVGLDFTREHGIELATEPGYMLLLVVHTG